MERREKELFVGVDTVKEDWGVSTAKAYGIIKELNQELKKEYPKAITIAGKVNKIYYSECCLRIREK